ncbi:MAG TPA: hypothetical protein VGQ15_12450 [Gaiellaceae bacterium]|nr:hypothetical protein [Gaiellaceae bacterium]
MTARAAAVVAAAALLVLAAGASGSGPAEHAPAICPRFDPAFRLEFGTWGGPGTSIPRHELYAAAVTSGSSKNGGRLAYGAATPTKATVDSACRATRLAPNPIDKRLSGRYRWRRVGGSGVFRSPSGDTLYLEPATGVTYDPRGAQAVTFTCVVSGRVTVAMVNSQGGTYLTVRIGRELYATAAVRPHGEFTFRVSKRCTLE